LQVANGWLGWVSTVGSQRILLSGKELAYRSGQLDYFAGDVFSHWKSLSSLTRPFFVVRGADPRGSIASMTGCDPAPNPRIILSRCLCVIMANWHGQPAVIHYAACNNGIAELARQERGLRLAAADDEITPLVARVLDHRQGGDGTSILTQTRISADPYRFSWRRIDIANEFWLSRRMTRRRGWDSLLAPQLHQVCDALPGFSEQLRPVADQLIAWSASAELPCALSHGDFWLGNVVFRGHQLAGIIDWEWAQPEGLPLADALLMLIGSHSMEFDIPFGEYFCQLWNGEFTESAIAERVTSLCKCAGIDREDLKFVGLVLWFDLLWQKVMGGEPSARWLADMITRTAPALKNWLGARSGMAPADSLALP
jgi:hypothetical protein